MVKPRQRCHDGTTGSIRGFMPHGIGCRALWVILLLGFSVTAGPGCSGEDPYLKKRKEEEKRYLTEQIERAREAIALEYESRLSGQTLHHADYEVLSRLKRETLELARRELAEQIKKTVKAEILDELCRTHADLCPDATTTPPDPRPGPASGDSDVVSKPGQPVLLRD